MALKPTTERKEEVVYLDPAPPITLVSSRCGAATCPCQRSKPSVLIPPSCMLRLPDDAQFFIGYSYNLQRDPKAHEAFAVLLRDFPYSVHAKQFVGKLPPAGPVTR